MVVVKDLKGEEMKAFFLLVSIISVLAESWLKLSPSLRPRHDLVT